MESNEKRWYVLHTYSGYENRVKSNLESRAQSMGMQDYIFRVVVPEDEVRQVKDGQAKEVVEKTFPGYVLVYCTKYTWRYRILRFSRWWFKANPITSRRS